jgi:O-antigen biosynthesis protein
MTMTSLSELYRSHRGKVSDKWDIYLRIYEDLLQSLREREVSILELGIQNSGSLELWAKYFPNAVTILGVDIDEKCGSLQFEDPRIQIVVADAAADGTVAAVADYSPEFDIIIDDASHRSGDIIKTFCNFFTTLNDDGLYIAEDLHCSYWQQFEGGLYNPWSSIAFFKRLADTPNFEHWGRDNSIASILQPFASKYGANVNRIPVGTIHSVEFFNSLCVVRKKPHRENLLGYRNIVGNDAHVNISILADKGSFCATPLGSDSTLEDPILVESRLRGEIAQAAAHLQQVQRSAELDAAALRAELHAVQDACDAAADRAAMLEQDLSRLNDEYAAREQELAAMYRSTSWRITAPIRCVRRALSPQRLLAESPFDRDRRSASDRTGQQGNILALARRLYARVPFTGATRHRISRNVVGRVLGRAVDARKPHLQSGVTEESLDASLLPETSVATDLKIPGLYLTPPLNICVQQGLLLRPRLLVIIPSLNLEHLSGGPNTALLLAAFLAECGENICIIASDAPGHPGNEALLSHMERLSGLSLHRDRITFHDAFDRSTPIPIGPRDVFLATAWWTAIIAKSAAAETAVHKLLYLIQDFEPIFHAASTLQARALETYGYEHVPIINTRLLLDHLAREQCGQYRSPQFVGNALVFEPAIDRGSFYPAPTPAEPTKRRLLFYARPTRAERNLFALGVAALSRAVRSGVLAESAWEIWGMGEHFEAVDLGNGVQLNPLPWMSFPEYAETIRSSDLMLSLMLSPHPSYPPLEMAACGKRVITNTCSVKTQHRLSSISTNIIAVEPNIEAISTAIQHEAALINAGIIAGDVNGAIRMPATWRESLGAVTADLKLRLNELRETTCTNVQYGGLPSRPQTEYERNRRTLLAMRRNQGPYQQVEGLISFVTSAYDTDVEYLEELAASVFLQDGGTQFEWILVDNGSTEQGTIDCLSRIAAHRVVRFSRVEVNAGIVGGMRHGLELASGRYVIPLDSDDLIEPDAVNVITRALVEQNFPPALFTDEDKTSNGRFFDPYYKPDWDPVLFAHSCYIAHMCVIDRSIALQLGFYSDADAQGCHDWDSFFRLLRVGVVPYHLAHCLYSWRVHAGSSAGNIASKDFIATSHKHVLSKFANSQHCVRIRVEESELFAHGVDWRFVLDEGVDARIPTIPWSRSTPLNVLASELETVCSPWVRLAPHSISLGRERAANIAITLAALFPDTAVIGGAVHDGVKITRGPMIFGFGAGFDSPDTGRPPHDCGYFVQMFKPRSVSAVPLEGAFVRIELLREAVNDLIICKQGGDLLPAWVGALAREKESRVIYTPDLRTLLADSKPIDPSPEALVLFHRRFERLIPEQTYYPRAMGLTADSAYKMVSEEARNKHLSAISSSGCLDYPAWLHSHTRLRVSRYPIPAQLPSVALLTTIYEGTDMRLTQELYRSVLAQTLFPSEWIIVAHGPLEKADIKLLNSYADRPEVEIVISAEPLGIMGAMRRALAAANADYVIPVDADDLLTPDAVQIVSHEISARCFPDLLFSDEDLLVDGEPATPFMRADFDPILNTDSSTIWHLCAIKRDTAVTQGLYSDDASTWCHDWDSVTRIASSAGRIEHVPEVLYHWRQHSGSTTNRAEGDPRSLESVRHLLECQRYRLPNPNDFEVRQWPRNRGTKELYLSLAETARLPTVVLPQDVNIEQRKDTEAPETMVVFLSGGVLLDHEQSVAEAARLFALHPSLGAVGGLVIDTDSRIVDACFTAADRPHSPWIGRSVNDGGAFATLLKPQTVIQPGSRLAIFRLAALDAAGLNPADYTIAPAVWMKHAAKQVRRLDWRIGFSPLVTAHTAPYRLT